MPTLGPHEWGLTPSAAGARTVSGSDTDVSTSAENLTHEEKYVLSHTERQDPQVSVDLGRQGPQVSVDWWYDPWVGVEQKVRDP